MDSGIYMLVLVHAGLHTVMWSAADSTGSIELNKFYGDNLNMPCPTSSVGSTSWKHRPNGNKNFFNVSTGRELLEKYSKYGRFHVLVNEVGGLSNLILSIDSVKLIDVGLFHCSEGQNIKITFKVSVSKIQTNLTETPANSTVLVGHRVQFNCSTSLPVPIYWQHIPVQAGSTSDVYLGKNGLQGEYLRGGRYTVDIQGNGVYNLIISDVQMSDAGTFLCWNDSGLGKKASAELVVLGDLPSCGSNSSVSRNLNAENNSSADDSEVIQHSCSVSFHGNTPPRLEWIDGIGTNGLESQITYVNTSFVVSSTIIQRSDWKAGTSFICRIRGSLYLNQDCSCTIPSMVFLQTESMSVTDDESHSSSYLALISLTVIVVIVAIISAVCYRQLENKRKNQHASNESPSYLLENYTVPENVET